MLPVAEFDNEYSNFIRHLSKSTAGNAKVDHIADGRYDVSERDSAFQRLLSTVIGLFKSNQKNDGHQYAAPKFEIFAEPPNTQPVDHADAIVIRGSKQLRTLYHLLHAAGPDGIPANELQHLTGSGNQWDVVRELNIKVGRNFIERTDYLIMNKTGRSTWRANYWLTAQSKRIAAEMLARAKYVHDEAPVGRHLNRPGMVASHFIASSGLDENDLLSLRNGRLPQWVRLLYLLRALNGLWVPRYVADELLDSRNVRQVVRVANAKIGDQAIESRTDTMPNRDGKACKSGLYRLNEHWFAKTDALIQAATMAK